MPPAHIPHNDLAAFIDGTCTLEERERIGTHLDACPDCLESYRAAVRARGMPDGNELPTLPPHIVSRVRGIIGTPGAGSSRGRRYIRRGLTATVAAAIVLLASIALWNRSHRSAFDPFAAGLAPITRVIAGYRGKMVFPGTEAFLPTSQPAYRSGAPVEPPDLSQSLSSLFDRFRRGDTTADENYWLAAGCVAADEAGLAREVILASRKRSLDDWRFDAVEAILAYRMNDLDAAREKLERAVANEPGSAEVHFNLAVVLHELGLETEAQQHRARALELATGSALGTREL